MLDGKPVARVAGNYRRKRVIKLEAGQSARSLHVEVTATNGVPEARVFTIAVF